MCNVGVFTEGTDIPNIDSIILARPTMSQSLMIQMIGRGLRLHKEKSHCHVIDLVGITKSSLALKATLSGEEPQEQEKRKYRDEKIVKKKTKDWTIWSILNRSNRCVNVGN